MLAARMDLLNQLGGGGGSSSAPKDSAAEGASYSTQEVVAATESIVSPEPHSTVPDAEANSATESNNEGDRSEGRGLDDIVPDA